MQKSKCDAAVHLTRNPVLIIALRRAASGEPSFCTARLNSAAYRRIVAVAGSAAFLTVVDFVATDGGSSLALPSTAEAEVALAAALPVLGRTTEGRWKVDSKP